MRTPGFLRTRSLSRRRKPLRGKRSRRPIRFERLEDRQLLAGDLVISEFMASNDTVLRDEDGDSSDWIEVHNPGDSPVSLAGWSLTDDLEALDQWTFPDTELAPDEQLVVFASGKDRRAPADVALRRDFVATSDATFLVDLADGSYDVRVTIGDHDRARVGSVLELQGEPVDTLTDAPGRFLVRTYSVEVGPQTDGQLAVHLQAPPLAPEPAVINGLTVTSTSTGQSWQFDFGPAGSAVAPGHVRVTPADLAGSESGFGWEPGGERIARDRGQRGLHTNFKLRAGGEALALVRPDGSVADDYGARYPVQITDVSYGIPAGGTSAALLAAATPGQPNGLARGSRVVFDRESGLFQDPFLLTLAAAAPDAIIHFTTDGTLPTQASPVYDGPLVIDATSHVQALAIAPGVAPGPIASGWFVKVAADLVDFESNLPVLVLDNFGRGFEGTREFRFNALALFEPDAETGRTSLAAMPSITSRSGVKVRGSSTADQPKKSLALEVWDENNRDRDIALLGMPAESDWVLFAPFDFDRAMIRNALIYRLSNQIGRYAPRTRFVELFRNTSGGDVSADDYVGVYTLIEKIKRGPDRVDLANLEPHQNAEPEISGGWLLKVDRPDPGDRGFQNDSGMAVRYVDPKESDVTPEQAAWIRNDFNEMFASLVDTDPATGYEQTIDVGSWIDHHLLNVLALNVDAFQLSAYFYRDRGGKYVMGPIWDFDRSMGSEDGRDRRPNIWGGISSYFEPSTAYPLWGRVLQDPNFKQRWVDRWFELRETIFTDENIGQIIDSMAAELAEAQVRNFERWPQVPPNGGGFAPLTTSGWESEIEHLRGWLFARLDWIDRQFLTPPAVSPNRTRLDPGDPIRLSAESGAIFYTTDGTDPRLPGGAVHPAAVAYPPTERLLDGASGATVITPTGAPAELGWQDPRYDDRAWTIGQAAVGFDTGVADPSIRVVSGFTVQQANSTRAVSTLDRADAVLGGQDVASEVTVSGLPVIDFLDGDFDGHFTTNRAFPGGGGDNFAIRATATIDVRAAGLYTFGVNSDEGSRLRIDGQNVIVDDSKHLPEDRFGSVLLAEGTHELEFVMFERILGAGAELFFAAGDQAEFSDRFRLLGDETGLPLSPWIRTDLEAAMASASASAFLRVPFTVSDVANVEQLLLNLQYDDGVVVWLNGTEVARRNAPDDLDAHATATAARADGLAADPEVLDLTPFKGALTEGENVLAIHGLNVSVDSPDFLIVPELLAFMAERPVPFTPPMEIVARRYLQGQWSAPARARFFEAGLPGDTTALAITEFNYHPYDPTDAERALDASLENSQFEFIELANLGGHTIDLSGVRLSGAIDFAFPSGVLDPGEVVVVARDRRALPIRYGGQRPVIGQFSGELPDDGGTIVLSDRDGTVLERFTYGDRRPWPERADGRGSSLERADGRENARAADHWRPSAEYGGSPGTAGAGPAVDVVINELVFGTDEGTPARLELYNPTDRPIDVAGWYLSDDVDDLFKAPLGQGAILGAGQMLILEEDDLRFALDRRLGGELWLVAVEDSAIRFADQVTFAAAGPGASLGRWPDGAGSGPLFPMVQPTLGGPNSGPVTGPAIVSEVHYNPPKLSRFEEKFEPGMPLGFTPVLGSWEVTRDGYRVTPGEDQNGDSIAVLPAVEPVTSRFTIETTLRIPATSTAKKNGAVVFDYRSPTDFKFVLLQMKTGRLKIGQRDGQGWTFLATATLSPAPTLDTDVEVKVIVDGPFVDVFLDGNRELASEFASSVGLGRVGLGSKNGGALFNRFSVDRTGEQEFEFIELHNSTSDPLDLTGWRLTGSVDMELPDGMTLPPGGVVVAVGFDPADDGRAEGFRRHFGVDRSVVLVGPYQPELDHNGQEVALVRPLAAGAAAGGLVLVDRVGYDERPPWPTAPGGHGRSLGRKSSAAFGALPASWVDQRPSPGSALFAEPGDLNVDGRIDLEDVRGLVLALTKPLVYETTYGTPATVAGDLDLDGDVDFDDISRFLILLGNRSTKK